MYLVTGATGFIGTNVVKHLVARGERVRILRRDQSNMTGLDELEIEERIGSVLEYGVVREAMRGCSRVFHLAGSVSLSPFTTDAMRNINVIGTELVARAALEEQVERIVFTSSSVTIGYGEGDSPADESTKFNLGSIGLGYIETKRDAELKILALCRQGLPAVIVNPGYVFGPWDKSPKLNEFLILAAKKKLNFYFSGGLSAVSVADVARGHLLAMEKGQLGSRYILSGENLSYREFFTRINAVLGQRPPSFPLPAAVVTAMGAASEAMGKVLGYDPTLSRAVARLYRINHFLSSENAKRDLGYMTTPLDDALRNTFQWLEEYGYI